MEVVQAVLTEYAVEVASPSSSYDGIRSLPLGYCVEDNKVEVSRCLARAHLRNVEKGGEE